MELRPTAVRELVYQLERLPGIGPRSALNLVEHLLRIGRAEAGALSQALAALRERVGHCSRCALLTESDPCQVCSDPTRERGLILVVEEPTTAWAVEATGEYHGLYHALLGHLSPLHGVGPDDLTISALLERAAGDEIQEVILALNPTVEGETTALYISRRLQASDVVVSRPASGIPVGGELATVDRVTLSQALQRRRKL